MARNHSSIKHWVSAVAIAGSIVAGAAIPVIAQGLPGLTIFSGVDREYQLSYRLDFEGVPTRFDRYRLRIPDDKMELAVTQFAITYPDTYEGTFDADEIEIRIPDPEDNDDEISVALDEVIWDEENRIIEIYPVEPVPANTDVEIVMHDVRNPRRPGMHYFNCLVQSPGNTTTLLRYIGTWIISIG